MLQNKDIENLLIAFAIGDAFGAGVEFQDRNWIRENVNFTKFVNVRDKIATSEKLKGILTKNYREWDYTDDTEMTIGTMKALMSGQAITPDSLVHFWKKEYENGIERKGFPRCGHGSMRWFYEGELTLEKVRNFQKNRPNPGNAPAMRAVPIGLVDKALINEYAAINAIATHPNLKAVQSSQIVAQATAFLLQENGDANEIIEYCLSNISLDEDYIDYLNNVEQLPDYEGLSREGYEVICGKQPIEKPYFLDGIHGLPSDSKYTAGCVLYILKWAKNPFDALQKSVNMGGDVDSLAAITTGVLGAKYGLDSLPKFMIESIEAEAYLTEVAANFYMKKKLKIGVVGFSRSQFDKQTAILKLRNILERIVAEHGAENLEIVSGYTNAGVPRIAYQLADDLDMDTIGVSAKQALRVRSGVYSVKKVILIGEKFGDESERFVEYIDWLIRIGGGPQSRREVELFKQLNNHDNLEEMLFEEEVDWYGK